VYIERQSCLALPFLFFKQYIVDSSESQFDPRVVAALVKVMEQDRQLQKDKAGKASFFPDQISRRQGVFS
jgi:hypothetical protein